MKTSIKIVLAVFTVLVSNGLFAQSTTFQINYGGVNEDMLKCVCATNDAGCIMAGVSNNFTAGGGYEIYLIKSDYAGAIQWARSYGAGGYDEATSVAQTSTGGYVVAGTTMAGTKIFVMLTNAFGDTIWTRTYGGNSQDEARCVRETADGGFIIIGSTRSFGDGVNYNAYLMKIDIMGNVEWANSFGRAGNDYGISGMQTSDGGFMLVGTDSLGGGHGGILLVKTDSLGSMQWAKAYGGIGDDYGYGGIQTSDGGYLITGESSSFGTAWDALIIKTDSAGAIEWTRNYGGTSADKGVCVAQLSNGNYLWSGTRVYPAIPANAQVFLMELDANGDSLWTKTYGTAESEDLQSMSVAANNQVYLGTYTSGSLLPDYYLIKTDPLGNSGCNENSGFGTFDIPATAITLQNTNTNTGSNVVPNTIMEGTGGTVTSLCLTLEVESPTPSQITLYPNPVTDVLSVSCLDTDSRLSNIQIMDILGSVQDIHPLYANGRIEFDVRNLAAGVYFMSVTIDDKLYVQRFIRE